MLHPSVRTIYQKLTSSNTKTILTYLVRFCMCINQHIDNLSAKFGLYLPISLTFIMFIGENVEKKPHGFPIFPLRTH